MKKSRPLLLSKSVKDFIWLAAPFGLRQRSLYDTGFKSIVNREIIGHIASIEIDKIHCNQKLLNVCIGF